MTGSSQTGRGRACAVGLVSVLLGIGASEAGQTVHRWVDAAGRVHFGDRPPPGLGAPAGSAIQRPGAVQAGAATRSRDDRPGTGAPLPADGDVHVVAQLRRLLEQGDFVALERRMAALEAAFAADYAAEDRLFKTLDAFSQWGESQRAPLDAWVAASPERYQPYLARAAYRFAKAWQARGRRWASQTTEARFEAMREHFARASVDLDVAERLNRRSVLPHYIRINIAVALGDHRTLSESLRRGLAIRPASYRVRNTYLNGLKPRWHGSHREMRQFVAESLHFAAQNPRLAHLEAEVIADEAATAWNEDQPEAAEAAYTRALAIGEEHRILGARAAVRRSLGRLGEALADIDRAIAIDGEHPDHHVTRSRILSKRDDHAAALAAVERAYALDPLDPGIRERYHRVSLTLGYEAHKRHDPAKALAQFDRAIELVADNADAFYRRSRALAELKREAAALRDVRRAIELDPDQIRFYTLIDWLLIKQRAYDEIITYWDRFIARHPDNGRAFLERAGTNYHKGDLAAARHDARRALALGNTDAQGLLQRLQAGR